MIQGIWSILRVSRCWFPFFHESSADADAPILSDRGVCIYGGFSFAGVRMVEFYKTSKWKHKRLAVLRRDGYLCQNCKRYGRLTPATTVHHIQHLEDRPDLALDAKNLISLCAACHDKAHPEKGGTRKR